MNWPQSALFCCVYSIRLCEWYTILNRGHRRFAPGRLGSAQIAPLKPHSPTFLDLDSCFRARRFQSISAVANLIYESRSGSFCYLIITSRTNKQNKRAVERVHLSSANSYILIFLQRHLRSRCLMSGTDSNFFVCECARREKESSGDRNNIVGKSSVASAPGKGAQRHKSCGLENEENSRALF